MERVDGKSRGRNSPPPIPDLTICVNESELRYRLCTYVEDGKTTTSGTSVNVALYSCRTCGNTVDGKMKHQKLNLAR
jgi:hypothetical protein